MRIYYSILSLCLLAQAVFAAPALDKAINIKNDSPAGTWTTIDDKTKAARAIVKLTVNNKKLSGRIIRAYKRKGDKGFCTDCPAPFTNKPIEGLRFIWGMSQTSPNIWHGGRILDPKSGTIYRCKMVLSDDGKKLYVRGYYGISLIGRTQTWIRRSTPI